MFGRVLKYRENIKATFLSSARCESVKESCRYQQFADATIVAVLSLLEVLIERRMSIVKLARSLCTDPPGCVFGASSSGIAAAGSLSTHAVWAARTGQLSSRRYLSAALADLGVPFFLGGESFRTHQSFQGVSF